MSEEVRRHVAAGNAALARGDWELAKNTFEATLALEVSGEALEGLGLAAWWLNLANIVFDSRERAYRIYHAESSFGAAARVAVWLAWDSAAFRGEDAVATEWLQRARRLLEGIPPGPEHAWLALRSGTTALLHDGHPEEAAELAAEAVRIADVVRAPDYAQAGRALHGYAEITAGRVAGGLRELDEVSASVLAGDVQDSVLTGLACWYLIAACDRIRDYERATQWSDRLKEATRQGRPRPLSAICRTQYASICIWLGAWDEAERELSAATDELADSWPAMTGEGHSGLGELRRRQGKLDEAMEFFDRAGAHPRAALGRAMVASDLGDFAAAADLADRYLRKFPLQNRTERAAGLELLSRAHIALGNIVDAQKAIEELHDIAARAQTHALRASAGLAAGIVLAGSGDPASARRYLEDAVDLFQSCRAPFETARARLALARVLGSLGRGDSAVQEAQRAIADLEALHADLELLRAREALAALTAPATVEIRDPNTEGKHPRAGLTARELQVLRFVALGLSNQAIAERLFISEHTVERHIANTLDKLDVPSRSAAVAQVARLGIL